MQTITLLISPFLGTEGALTIVLYCIVLYCIVFLCNNMAVFAWPVSLGLIMRWYRYVVNITCTLRVACTVNLSYTGLSYNIYFHSPIISLCCLTVTASDLWLHRISLTFPNSWCS